MISTIEVWLPNVIALSFVLTVVVLVVLVVLSVRLALSGGPGVYVRTRSTSRGWTVEDLAIGLKGEAGMSWYPVRMTWQEAAEWAAETSRRPDVQTAWVDVPTASGRLTSWLWEAGIQTRRMEAALHG
ncbi:hypothetical protein GCM10010156_76460 [Planobispora rosea]|uniref:Uncharacterized protein n=1 Tax=Planobispora rosea TaxID=35762 RepID=A0A8J3WHB3_PLARO|nr:hypothetical protein [Planobispora rosea]GGT08090.1 hypothetical protein GCM10010156_76460 [Planobispora rosea]GIH89315.1 hypothetical protein Pro02_77230 [Planobispora rosea]